jgi:hypothetical protein
MNCYGTGTVRMVILPEHHPTDGVSGTFLVNDPLGINVDRKDPARRYALSLRATIYMLSVF